MDEDSRVGLGRVCTGLARWPTCGGEGFRELGDGVGTFCGLIMCGSESTWPSWRQRRREGGLGWAARELTWRGMRTGVCRMVFD